MEKRCKLFLSKYKFSKTVVLINVSMKFIVLNFFKADKFTFTWYDQGENVQISGVFVFVDQKMCKILVSFVETCKIAAFQPSLVKKDFKINIFQINFNLYHFTFPHMKYGNNIKNNISESEGKKINFCGITKKLFNHNYIY